MKRKILLLVLIICGIFTFHFSSAFYPSASRIVSIFSDIIAIVKREYVQDITDDKLIEGAISGMLTSLDPYSSYLNNKEFEELKANARGEFGGLGIELIIDNGLRIITPIDDTPAYYAGIKPGDIIIAVNDELVAKMTPSEAISKIKGPKGTKVKITILREGENKPLEFNLLRDIIKLVTVKWHLYDDIAYIRISSFVGNTYNDVKKSIMTLNDNNKKIAGYVLDLRNNPGGLLKECVHISELFLEDGIIVSTKGRNAKDNEVYKASPGSLVGDTPIVVLINGGSASASEIVAGALQDNKRATIMGTKSFGKASVQSIIPVPSLDSALRLTTALYYTPSGKSIQKEGIIPDIIVEIPENKSSDSKPADQPKEEKKNLRNPDDIKTANWIKLLENDYQLKKAIEYIHNPSAFEKKK